MADSATKRFYVQNANDWKKYLGQNKILDRKLEVKVIKRGIILPARPLNNGTFEGGVCDSKFNFIAGFSKIPPYEKACGGGWSSLESAYTVERKEIVELNEDVIFGGTLMGHFGHFILECWSRLWYVIQNPDVKSKILFITTTHGGYKSWFDDFFRLMGIEENRIVYVKQPMQCRSIAVPEQSQYEALNMAKFTKEFFEPYQAIKSNVKPADCKKLYLTRAEFAKDGLYPRFFCNEKYYEDFFTARGFKVIAPEKLSIEEQISLVMGADEIVAIQGTLTHWAMFCKPSAKFIMFTRSISAEGIQLFINEAFGVDNYYIVEAWKEFLYVKSHIDGVFLLGSTKYWKEFVADYFGEQIDEADDAPYLDAAIDNYVELWCKKYLDTKNLEPTANSFKKLCHRIVELEVKSSKNRPLLSYQTHIGKKGWGDGWKSESSLSNTLDQQLDIQAIKIDFQTHKVFYAVYWNDTEGWSKEVAAPEMAGTTGKNKPITGIKIRLDEAGAKDFDILYRVHKFDGAWTNWAKNGEIIYSHGQKLNAIQIKLKPKSDKNSTEDSPPLEK